MAYGEVTPEMFGAVGDGVTDDTNAFIDMFTAGPNVVKMGTRKQYVINQTLDIDIVKTPIIYGNNAALIAKGIPDNSILLNYFSTRDTSTSYSFMQNSGAGIYDLIINGFDQTDPDNQGAKKRDTTALKFSFNGRRLNFTKFANISIFGFTTGIEFGEGCYCMRFDNVNIGQCEGYGIYFPQELADAGEKVTFIGCDIFECRGIKILKGNPLFTGCSFDYGNMSGGIVGGSGVTFDSCHFERASDSSSASAASFIKVLALGTCNLMNSLMTQEGNDLSLTKNFIKVETGGQLYMVNMKFRLSECNSLSPENGDVIHAEEGAIVTYKNIYLINGKLSDDTNAGAINASLSTSLRDDTMKSLGNWYLYSANQYSLVDAFTIDATGGIDSTPKWDLTTKIGGMRNYLRRQVDVRNGEWFDVAFWYIRPDAAITDIHLALTMYDESGEQLSNNTDFLKLVSSPNWKFVRRGIKVEDPNTTSVRLSIMSPFEYNAVLSLSKITVLKY